MKKPASLLAIGIGTGLSLLTIGCNADIHFNTVYSLTVNSVNPANGVSIAVSQPDVNGAASGSTSFTLTYSPGTEITLTAPASVSGRSFSSWTGCTSSDGDVCTVIVTNNTTVAAAYVAPALISPTVTVAPSPSSIAAAESLSVTVSVSGGSGKPTPTGAIVLSSGAYASSSTVLSSGSATITLPVGSLAVGTDTLTATYTPDSASSATFTSATGTNTVTVTAGSAAPTVTLTANPTSITSGESSILTWSSTNATSCTASSGWSGTKATSGNLSVSPTSTTSYTLTCTGASGSAEASVTLTVVSSVNNLYIYQNDDGTGNKGLYYYWDNDYSFGNNDSIDYTDTTHPESGHTYDLFVDNLGWQPATDTHSFGGPFGLDISAYTWMTFDIWTATPTHNYDSNWEYLGGSGNADQPTPAYVSNITTVPGVGSLNSGAWTTVKIPLAYFGQLGMHAVYKFFLRDNTSTIGVQQNQFYLDNVGLVPGSYSWIYDGGAVNSWNISDNNWNWDTSTPLNGWADATSAGATADYTFNPSTLTNALPHGASSLNGLVGPGNGSSIVSTNAIALSINSAGGMWKVTNSVGFMLSPYTYLTFGLLPTNNTHSYIVQFYSTTGQPIGNAVDPANYTNRDWGPTGQYWTVYCIPLSAFFGSSIPATVGGLSIQDTIELSANTIYITAAGFFTGSSSSVAAPAVTLTATPSTITSGNSSTLTWSSTNANTCTASGGWSGSENTSGSQSVSPTSTTSYTLTCKGAGGSGSAMATVTVTAPSLIMPTLTVAPSVMSITTAQSLNVTVSVSGGSGNPTPTGTIILSSGTYASSSTALSNGSITISISAGSLTTGTDSLTATYTPDSVSSTTYNSATGTGSVTVTGSSTGGTTNVIVDEWSSGRAVTDQILGMNMAIWYDIPNNRTAIVNAFQTAGIKAVRWPGGSDSDLYHWANNSMCAGAMSIRLTPFRISLTI
jgi:hypothetical protein